MLIDQAPGSLTTWAPLRWPGCQTPNTAPDGSARTAMRAPPGDSNGSPTTLPPAAAARSTAASALSTQTYVAHVGTGGGGAPCGDTTAATSRPRSLQRKYLPSEPAGIRSSTSQPNSSE